MILYSSTPEPYTGPPIDLANANATKAWFAHKENEQILKFFIVKGTRLEKQDASKELVICERKQKYWERHPNFDQDAAVRLCEKLDKQWRDK